MRLLRQLTSCKCFSLVAISAAWLSSLALLRATHGGAFWHHSINWFTVGQKPDALSFSVGVYIDFAAAVMLCLTTGVGLGVYLYSIGYMRQVPGQRRYFTWLCWAMLAMVGLIVADNGLCLLMCWELLGLASYRLIGFSSQQKAAAAASTKAWLINHLGSVGLLLALLVLGTQLGTLDLVTLSADASLSKLPTSYQLLAGLGLIVGVMAKSAQFPLFHWLPSAMTAPAPASALLHAATLVSAGAYVLLRLAAWLGPDLQQLVAGIGALTALMGACAGPDTASSQKGIGLFYHFPAGLCNTHYRGRRKQGRLISFTNAWLL